MNMKIRPARYSDLDTLVMLLQDLFSVEADFTVDKNFQHQGLTLLLDGCGKHRCVNVAEIDTQVVGMCTAQTRISTAEGGVVALVEDVVVAHRYRGMGIGRSLMASIEEWARDHGVLRLQLLADRTNFSALYFYHNIGWLPTQLICLRKK